MTTDDQTAENESTYPRPAYAWYVVVLMMCFYVLSFMDRQIIAVMLDPIKDDLALTDFQIAMVHGWGFGLFYAVVGIFIGRLADSMNRPFLIAMGVFIWSLTTALCGLASKFWHLFFLRMGVGLGEAALLPSTLSLLKDYFPTQRLATPTSVFLFGAPIGIGLSFVVGGFMYGVAEDITAASGWTDVAFIGGTAAWKLVLIFLGVVGMSMTIGMITVREPRTTSATAREAQAERSLKAAEAAEMPVVKAYARKNRLPILSLYIGMALISLAAYAQGLWDVTYLTRTFGGEVKPVAFMYGMVQMFAGIAGMLLGGITADRLTRHGVEGSSYKLVILGAAIATPFGFTYALMGTESMSLWLMVGTIFGTNMCFACAASAMQRMYPAAMLGLAAGIYFFMSNAVGLMVGPPLVAAITDYGFGDPQKVGYSLSIVGGTARLLAFVVFVVGLRSYVRLLREREGNPAT